MDPKKISYQLEQEKDLLFRIVQLLEEQNQMLEVLLKHPVQEEDDTPYPFPSLDDIF